MGSHDLVVALVASGGIAGVCCIYAVLITVLLNLACIQKTCGCFLAGLLMFLSFGGIFLGGMVLNIGVWGFVTLELTGIPFGVCSAIPCFFTAHALLSLAMSRGSPLPPFQQYRQLELEPHMTGVDICDQQAWKDYEGGIYFNNGVLMHGGALRPASWANVTHYGWVSSAKNESGHWRSCSFQVRPIYKCDPKLDPFCSMQAPCAWAINSTGPPEPRACSGTDGVCGVRRSFLDLYPLCPGPDANPTMTLKQACWRGRHELKEALTVIAQESKDAWDLAGDLPLVELMDPHELKEDLSWFYKVLLVLAFIYVPLPMLCYIVALAYFGRKGGNTRTDYSPVVSDEC